MKISSLILSLLVAAVSSYDVDENYVPVPGTHVGLSFGGKQSGLKVELFYDLLCPVSADLHPKILELMEMDFLGKQVKDVVEFNFVLFPLPYHRGSWVVTKLIPYFIDICHEDASKCDLYLDYLDFCFKNMIWIQNDFSYSDATLTDVWVSTVAQRFKFKAADLKLLYDRSKDTHNSEMRVRELFKYACHRSVNSTPTQMLNGAIIQGAPSTARAWLKLL